MRIAQIAPLTESIPPQAYGGTERVVSYLTEMLVELGHEVTLYASGDSVSAAELRACCPRALRYDAHPADRDLLHERMMRRVLAEAGAYDVIHFHTGWYEFRHFTGSATPCLATMHGPMNVPEIQQRVRPFAAFPLVSISDAQRRPLAGVNWIGTVYHGLPEMPGIAEAGKHDYLVFLGRISPEKRPDLAIAIAQRAGRPLKIAAKVDPVDRGYFESTIRPLLGLPGIEFLGEVAEADKMRLLAGAQALLFPIDWPEPFGLVMIEAMACGTPVIAFARGSVPEVIDEGVTGHIVGDVAEAAAAVAGIAALDRRHIRAVFRRRFSARRMAGDYVQLYEAVMAPSARPKTSSGSLRPFTG